MEIPPAQTPPLVSGNDVEDAQIAIKMRELYRDARSRLADIDELQVDDHNSDVLTDSDLKPVLQCAVVLAVKDVDNVDKYKPFIEKIMMIHDQADKQQDKLRDAMKRLLKQPKKDDHETDEQEFSVLKKLEDLELRFRVERFSALHMAAAWGNLEMVKLLVGELDRPDGAVDKYGLLDEKTEGGWTALHLCSNEGHEAVVEFLMLAHTKKGETRYVYGDEKENNRNASDFMMDKRGSTPLHFAVWNCHSTCVEQLLKCDDTGFLANQRSMDIFFLTPLHVISMRSSYDAEEKEVRAIADSLLKHARKKYGRFECINTRDCCKFTPLHWAVRSDSAELVRLYLDPANSSDNIDVLAEDVDGKTPLHIAVEAHHTRCEDLLMSNKRVRRELERLHAERQVFVESTNAILIGASLIAGVTFAAYLQPPLGWVTYYNEKPFSAAPPGEFRQYAAVGKDAALKAFWILDCLAFLVSIATILTSTQNVLRRDGVHLKDDIRRTAKWLQPVSALFQLSVCCILGAFVAAGIADLPDDFTVRKYTYLPTGVLGSVLLLMILTAAKKWGWKFTGNGHVKRFFNSLRRRTMKDFKGWMAAGAESLRENVRSTLVRQPNEDTLQLRVKLVDFLQRIAMLDDRMEVMEEVKHKIEERRRSKDPTVNYHGNLSPETCREHAKSELQKASKRISGIRRLEEPQFAKLENLVRDAVRERERSSVGPGVEGDHACSTDSRVQILSVGERVGDIESTNK